ncbi:hypothetical protein AB1E18_006628 [Capra hircus]
MDNEDLPALERREVGRAMQAALDGGSASGGAWSGVHMEASQLAWQHGEQQVQEGIRPSTSMRLPASSVKLSLKLEQYFSATQRSESVKCANPSHTEFLVAPVDVTSKRHLFEKELVGQSRRPSLQPQGELAALRGGEVTAQPVDQQDPGVSTAGPTEPGDAVRTPSTEAEAKSTSPTRALPTFSSSLQHSSRHTISFRMSPRRGSSEAALTRSTSVRLPARSVKIGLKLEQYLSAIQRSESVRYANPSHTEFLVAPMDVTSKCHLFEKELVGQSRRSSLQPQGELAALRGGEVTAQPVDQQDPGVSTAGPTEPGDAAGVGSWQEAPVEEEARAPTGCRGVRSQSQASSRTGLLSCPLSTLDPRGCWPASSSPSGAGVPRALSVCGHCVSAQSLATLSTWTPALPPPLSIRSHQCLRAPLPGWPPPSLCRLPGWRSHADPSQALPCSLSYPTCCPG